MSKKLLSIIDAIRTKDYAYATEGIGRILESKVQNALDAEKRATGADLLKEDKTPPKKPLPAAAKAFRDPYRDKNGEPICQNCEKPGSKCDCEPHGNFVESVSEETVPQYEVQRIYDEVGDIGETELLCGITNLRVNPAGQVISYICESYSDPEVADASDFGWKPGEWPKVFKTPDGVWHFDKFIKHGSEIEAAMYRGIELGKPVFLKVYND